MSALLALLALLGFVLVVHGEDAATAARTLAMVVAVVAAGTLLVLLPQAVRVTARVVDGAIHLERATAPIAVPIPAIGLRAVVIAPVEGSVASGVYVVAGDQPPRQSAARRLIADRLRELHARGGRIGPAFRARVRVARNRLTGGRWQLVFRGLVNGIAARAIADAGNVPLFDLRGPLRILTAHGIVGPDAVEGVDESRPHPIRPIVIARFDHPHEFQLARAVLQGNGIAATADNLFLAAIDWRFTNALGQIRLAVAQPVVRRATESLRATPAAGRLVPPRFEYAFARANDAPGEPSEPGEPVPPSDGFDERDAVESVLDRCPTCQSPRMAIARTGSARALLVMWAAAYLGAPWLPSIADVPVALAAVAVWHLLWFWFALRSGVRLRCRDCRVTATR